MSFFKELKEDIAQSVNELTESLDEDLAMDEAPDAKEVVAQKPPQTEVPVAEPLPEPDIPPEEPVAKVADVEPVQADPVEFDEEDLMKELADAEPEIEETEEEVPVVEMEPETVEEPEEGEIVSEEIKEEVMEEMNVMPEEPETVPEDNEEVTVITKGTTINGGIKSDTSLVVKGTIEGDVECQGKLTITGRVAGNTIASEIYVNTPRLEGDINSRGIVKVDVGTVVLGNINCTSVLVSGAVKGNIEVNGPVIVDSTAVVKGDIKAKSIQINSGAVIDGHCSLAFADVDLDSFFA